MWNFDIVALSLYILWEQFGQVTKQFGQVIKGVIICKQCGSKKNCIFVQCVLKVETKIQTNDIGRQDQAIHHGGGSTQ
jgi:hypothetical protein